MSRKIKFPTPADCKPAEPAVLCPADRVIGLYNQDSGYTAQRIAKKVRTWFRTEAIKKGWAGVRFLTDVQSSHGAGCVLWRPPDQVNISITITNQLVLVNQADE
jgi:hypothetical protein